MSNDQKTLIEASAIYDELKLKLADNQHLQDLLAFASLTDGQREVVQTTLLSALCEGFRLGLDWGISQFGRFP